jgi:hypothetical protein
MMKARPLQQNGLKSSSMKERSYRSEIAGSSTSGREAKQDVESLMGHNSSQPVVQGGRAGAFNPSVFTSSQRNGRGGGGDTKENGFNPFAEPQEGMFMDRAQTLQQAQDKIIEQVRTDALIR